MQARQWLKQARSIVVLTGAGVSAESGVPTFRENNGLWRNFRAEDLATPQAFARDPKLVWEWYDWRRSLIAGVSPNPGHEALAAIERFAPRFTLITQNVDDLHERAGSRNVLHVHGSIFTLRCTSCNFETEDHSPHLPDLPPRCACGALLRPGVVWFGESLPPAIWQAAENAVREADLMLVVGTSGAVYPAAGLAALARQSNARVVEINKMTTPNSAGMHECLQGASGEILPRLIA